MMEADRNTIVLQLTNSRGVNVPITLSHFEHPKQVKEKLCSICGMIYTQAVEIISRDDIWKEGESGGGEPSAEEKGGAGGKCGHCFCRHCLQQSIQQAPKCPLCRHSTSLVVKALQIRREVADLIVKCMHDKEGCDWKGELGTDCKNYLSHLESCPCRGHTCAECKQIIEWDVKDHSCPEELVPCVDSGSGIGCLSKIKRKDLSRHVATCEMRPVSCAYGCEGKFAFNTMPHHDQTHALHHLLSYQQLMTATETAAKLKIQQLMEDNKSLRDGCNLLSRDVAVKKKQIESLEAQRILNFNSLGILRTCEWVKDMTETLKFEGDIDDDNLGYSRFSVRLFNYLEGGKTEFKIGFYLPKNGRIDQLEPSNKLNVALSILSMNIKDNYTASCEIEYNSTSGSNFARFTVDSKELVRRMEDTDWLTFSISLFPAGGATAPP